MTNPARHRSGTGAGRPRPVVAVVGRPNVGKSTLVNRIVGRRVAVVEERPGVTRDRKEVEAEWQGRPFTVVDTGGWLASGDALEAQVSAQAERAVAEADLILLVVDGVVGVVEEDLAVARLLQRCRPAGPGRGQQGGLAPAVSSDAWSAVSLGLGDPWPVSALHGRGMGDLLDEVVVAPARPRPDEVAEVGVGRRIRAGTGEHGGADRRAGVPAGGARRSAQRGQVHALQSAGRRRAGSRARRARHHPRQHRHRGRDARRAGVLRRHGRHAPASRTERGTEYFSVLRALEALDRADIALLVIDATAGITHQDQRLAERVGAAGCPTVVVLNKWEMVATEERPSVLADVGDRLAFLGDAPVLKVSARSGRGVHRILPAVMAAEEAYHTRIPTGELNRAMRAIQAAHPPVGAQIRYAVQGATDPPTFTLFTNGRLQPTYLRYVERGLRERFELGPDADEAARAGQIGPAACERSAAAAERGRRS